MKVKRHAIDFALGLTLILTWLLTGAYVPGAQAVPQNPTANVIYVDVDAAGPADGLTWTTAFTNVQDALSGAAPGDEIWVAEGVYTPTAGITRTATFQLKNGVTLYGGFAATETLYTQRDWETHVTILSGDLGGNDVTDANGVVTDTVDIVGDNTYHVVTGSGVTETSKLDGFVITGGKADGSSVPHSYGGGMYNDHGNPTLTNVTFRGNVAYNGSGGGMYNRYSAPTMINVTFSSNSAQYGGGMCNDYSDPTLTDITFSDNSAGCHYGLYYYGGHGGGMCNDHSNPTLTNVTFSSNSATQFNGSGGGMVNYSSSPMLTNVIFSDNSARYGGGMDNYDHSNPVLANVTFNSNSSSDGGGMGNYDSNPVLINVTFSGNSSSAGYGGGMYNQDSSLTLINVTFTGNAAGYGGGVYNASSSPTLINVTFGSNAAGDGGGMYNDYFSNPRLTNITFSGNRAASDGGGIYNFYNSRPTLVNCILWGNEDSGGTDQSAQIYLTATNPITVAYSLVQGGVYTGTSNISTDPEFVRPPDPGDGDLRLQASSPAIDAGDNTALPADVTDLDGDGDTSESIPFDRAGRPRIKDIVDMGAYEWWLQVFLPVVLKN